VRDILWVACDKIIQPNDFMSIGKKSVA